MSLSESFSWQCDYCRKRIKGKRNCNHNHNTNQNHHMAPSGDSHLSTSQRRTYWNNEISHVGHLHDQPCRSGLYSALQPLYLALNACGVYHTPLALSPREENGISEPVIPNKRFSICSFWYIYCLVVTTLVCGNTIRCWLTLSKNISFGTSLFQAVTALLFATQCSLLMISYVTRDSTYFVSLHSQINEMRLQNAEADDPQCHCKSRRRALRCVFGCAAFVMFNTGCTLYVFLQTDALTVWLFPYNRGDYSISAVVVLVFTFLVYVIEQCVWILTTLHYVVICYDITEIFTKITTKLKELKQLDSVTELHEQFEDIRLQHNRMCNVVDTANVLFAVQNLVTFLFQLVLCCVVLYDVIYLDTIQDTHSYILTVGTHVTWFLDCVLCLGVTITAGAALANAAHYPLSELHGIKLTNTSSEFRSELIMFSSRLSTTRIGMTVANLFVINKETVLTMLSLFLTYFILLLQFRPPESHNANCGICVNNTNVSST